jgi:hypothetical protein
MGSLPEVKKSNIIQITFLKWIEKQVFNRKKPEAQKAGRHPKRLA